MLKKITAVLIATGLTFCLAIAPVAAFQVEPDDNANASVIEITDALAENEGEANDTQLVEANEPEEFEEVIDSEEDETLVPDDGNEAETTDETEVLESILTPDSPFYFIKRFIENIRLILTFDQEKKVSLLEELTAERTKELEALQQQYTEGEISEAQLATLEQALDDLVAYTERLVDELAKVDDEAGQSEDDADEETEELGQQLDKYERRIIHLQSIANRTPESAQKGLARAIENAERQRERAVAKGRIPEIETVKEENDEADAEGTLESIEEEEVFAGEVETDSVEQNNNSKKEKPEKNGSDVLRPKSTSGKKVK